MPIGTLCIIAFGIMICIVWHVTAPIGIDEFREALSSPSTATAHEPNGEIEDPPFPHRTFIIRTEREGYVCLCHYFRAYHILSPRTEPGDASCVLEEEIIRLYAFRTIWGVPVLLRNRVKAIFINHELEGWDRHDILDPHRPQENPHMDLCLREIRENALAVIAAESTSENTPLRT